nr:hypothetical protein [Acetobacter persici]
MAPFHDYSATGNGPVSVDGRYDDVSGVRHLDLSDMKESAPAALTFLTALLTGNLINGMAIGTLSYTTMALATGRARTISPVVWGLCVIFIMFFIVSAHMHGHHA